MCIKPKRLHFEIPGKPSIDAPCGHCWACLKNKQWDLIGRALGEAAHCDWSVALTLTYDDQKLYDPRQTKFLHHEDFVRFQARLRKKFSSKYLAAGEYGERKGRAHWHLLLMGRGTPPKIKNKKLTNWHLWPYGFIWADWGMSEKKIRYVAKYLIKEKMDVEKRKIDGSHRMAWVGYSKRPILGEKMIKGLAVHQAQAQLFPSNLNYLPPGASPTKWRYTLKGKAEEIYFDTLFEVWPDAWAARKNESIEPALLRYKKLKANRVWDALPSSEIQRILGEGLNIRHGRGLTKGQIAWDTWLQEHPEEYTRLMWEKIIWERDQEALSRPRNGLKKPIREKS